MIYTENDSIKSITLHKVGNKVLDEGIKFSKSDIKIDSYISELLIRYFFAPFKSQEYYNFFHESDINLNEVFVYAKKIFEDSDSILEQSKNLAKHLYEKSIHPKVKGGEFYTVYFEGCIVDGKVADAIGLFKSESKETYLRVYSKGDDFEINSENGININKLDKGCLIFNIEEDKGFLVAVVDNLNKGADARYWKEDFLHVRPRKDEYFYTQNVMSLCKNFTSDNPAIDKAQKADILNKAVSFFEKNDSFDMDDFSNQIMKEEGMIKAFQTYKSQYEKDREVIIADDFTISEQALKKQSRSIKNIIKLDNNFKISIDGDTRYLEKGYDESKKLNYYKLFYNNEE